MSTPRTTSATRGLSSGAVKIGTGLLVGALVVGAGVSSVRAGQHTSTASTGNPVKTHPAPALFPAAQAAPIGRFLAAQKPIADRAFAAWSAGHPTQDDAAFTAFVTATVPPPPDAAQQAVELGELHRLAAARTPAGIAAASWLETYGKKDVWKLYVKDATELQPNGAQDRAKAELKTDTALAKALTASLQAKYARQAPYITDPSLRPGNTTASKSSYPSKHAVYIYSELALLTRLDPGRATEFQAMVDQVAYSRLYAAGHYRSDLVAGALVGDLLGDYEARGTTSAS
ncbi:MAG: hypothetical protein JWN17_1917 [Frankiales bacterium]|nr:hypothetical protein [Frankiales bacterium]